MSGHSRTLLVLVGPTAVGKTDLAAEVAQRLSTEVISADARQIFREMKIGTAKPDPETMSMAPHHFIDSHSIFGKYDAAEYEKEALALIRERFREKSVLILCGGSGLYVQAVCRGLDDIPEVPADVRENVRHGYGQWGLDWLQKQMDTFDPEYSKVIDRKNPHRLMRALEVRLATGESISRFQRQTPALRDFIIVKIGLEDDRDELYRRIDQRMERMIARGLFEEAAALWEHRHLPALQTVGYTEVFDYLEGKYDREETIRLLKRNSRRYAKRQLTWFKKDPEIKWFHPSEKRSVFEYISQQITS